MLQPIHVDIDARVQSIRDSHADWPCRRGCSACCRSLAGVPRLTPPEWALLREGLSTLPADRLAQIAAAVAALSQATESPVVCPLLDDDTGACRVYAYRPVACRTYGYYVQRDLGLYCKDIEAQVAAGACADLVWGNHDAIDRRLAGCGPARELTAWFREEISSKNGA